MKVYYKSNNRIKNIANAGQILPSNTPTHSFPHDGATVVLTQTKNQFPSFRIHLRGKEKHSTNYQGKQYSYSSVTRVDLDYRNNEYITAFYGGGIPLNELSETMQLVKDIKDSVINNTPLNPWIVPSTKSLINALRSVCVMWCWGQGEA